MKLDAQISAVVTGGASGLGAASARVLGETGVQVTLFDLDEERGSSLAKELDGHFVRVDVTDVESVRSGLAAARDRFGQERILVNCAGIAHGERTVSRSGAHDAGAFCTGHSGQSRGHISLCQPVGGRDGLCRSPGR